MKIKELAKVLGSQFIAIEYEGEIRYSGSADKGLGWVGDREVESVKAPRNEYSAMVIIAK